MTQNEKDLLLKDLCVRLPYGVKVQRLSYQIPLKILSINPNGVTWVTRDKGYPFEVDWVDCKPYLFPLSSMTEEQKSEINLLSKEECDIIEYIVNNPNPNNVGFPVITYYMVDWCNKNHFDYRELIPMGLAIDATGLNIY